MRKILGLLIFIFLLFSGNCFAMQFSQPVKIGGIFIDQTGKQGVIVKNASYNDGDYYTKARKNNRNTYGKGIARFGNDKNALYVHYNYYTDFGRFYFGGKDKQNTIVSPNIVTIYDIFKIDTNEGITIYPLYRFYGPESEYIIIGRRADGKFVKYIDTKEITKRYFGWNMQGVSPATYVDLSVQGDILVMKYCYWNRVNKTTTGGRFIFKWDDNAQWFSVDRTVDNVRSGY